MSDRSLFDKNLTDWRAWVDGHAGLWTHIHLSGLVLWHRDEWRFISGTVVLAVENECEPPRGLEPLWPREVCAYRVSVPIENLRAILDGLTANDWTNQVPGLDGAIRFVPPASDEPLSPSSGEPRLEAPNFGLEVVRSENRWPRYTVDFQGPTLENLVGTGRQADLAALDKKLKGRGKPGLSGLAQHFGCVTGSSDRVADIWKRQTSIRLVAPLLCQFESIEWNESRSALMASVDVDRGVPRGRVGVVVHDPKTVGFPDPVLLPDEGESPVFVTLASKPVSDNASVTLLVFDEEIQKERVGYQSGRSRTAHMVSSIAGDRSDRYGGWQVVGILGKGGQAEVRRVEKGRLVGALKEVREGWSDPARVTRLRREIDFLKRFSDVPFLVRLLDSSDDEAEMPFLITALAPLGNADEHAQLFGGDVWRTLRLARDIATALRHLHKDEVIHRDVKSKNIFLLNQDTPVLADLGVAFDLGQSSLTTTGDPVYSGWFSPPESKVLGRPTPAFDVFMLGQTIYHLVSGGNKYRRKDVPEPDMAVDAFVLPSAGPVVTSLIRRMVAEKAADRLQTMDEVIRAIDETLSSIFGARGGSVCSACGLASYEKIGGLQLTTVQLTVTRDAREVPLGNRNIILFVCPKCGTCRLQLDESMRAAFFPNATGGPNRS
jgi:hypothetical protein